MSDYREEVILAASVPTDPFRCPRCKGENLTLKGNVTRAFEERLQQGNTVEQKFAEELQRETSEIDCHSCQIAWKVMTEAEADLSQKNLTLEHCLLMHSHSYVKQFSTKVH